VRGGFAMPAGGVLPVGQPTVPSHGSQYRR